MANFDHNGPWTPGYSSIPRSTADKLHHHTDPYLYGSDVGPSICGQTMRTPGSWPPGSDTGAGLRSWVATGEVWDYAGWAGIHLPDQYSKVTRQSQIAHPTDTFVTADAPNCELRYAPTPPLDLSSSESVLHIYRQMGAPDPIAAEPDADAQAGIRCLWGGRCGTLLANATVQEIRAHLREAHGVPGRDRTARIPCLWDGRCSRSSDFILPGGMGKHVATCHFKIMRRSCASCGQAFCRQDSLVRHEYLYCPKLRGDKRRKKPAARRVLSERPTSA